MSLKGYKMSEEHKKKIGLANRGKIRSEELIKRWGQMRKGKPSPKRGIKLSKEHIEKIKIARARQISSGMKGRHLTEEHKRKAVATRMRNGTYRELTTEERLRKKESAPKGQNHYNWKGGVTSNNLIIRNSLEYRLWRESVFERDNYTCRFCGTRGGKLNADHIKPFAYFPELRFAIDNGRTLCVNCHRKTNTYAKRFKLGINE